MALCLSCCSDPTNQASTPTSPLVFTDPQSLHPLPTPPEGPLSVLATTTIVADVVASVGGELIELQTLIPAGVDPHAYEPAPADLTAIANADVIFVNGFGLEESLMDLLVNAKCPIISLSVGIEGRVFGQEELGDLSEGDEIRVGQIDPHVWFDPASVENWVGRIRETFGRLDPEHARTITGNSGTYLERLKELDHWIEERVAVLPEGRRLLVTDHLVFGYFAERYGFEMVGAIVPAASTLAEPSARELARLEDQILSLGIKAIFIGAPTNPNLAQSIATDTGVRLIQVYTGSLGSPGSAADDYVSFMRYNVNAIVNGLKD